MMLTPRGCSRSLLASRSLYKRAWLSMTSVRTKLFKSVPEQPVPVEGQVTGALPDWLSGRLIRNGPGLFEIGDTKLNHWFDGMALLHSFTIQSSKVSYTSKFLRSDSYTRNMAANRLVVSEFGTVAVPDPCKTLFQRVQSYFTSLVDFSHDLTDNCNINLYPAGDKFIAATEGDFVHVFTPETLDSDQRVQLSKHVAVNMATAHPHIDRDGTVYNLGSSTGDYAIIKIPPTGKYEHVMDKASVLCTVQPNNRLKPSYIHSFAATENYFVFLEQPFHLDIVNIMKRKLFNKPLLADGLFIWNENGRIHFHIVEKSSGKVLSGKFYAPPAIILHHINAYEDRGHIVLDGCAYPDGLMYFDLDLQTLRDSKYQNRVHPRRYVLPIRQALQDPSKENLVTLDYTEATAQLQEDGSIFCHPESISEKTFEMPRINYNMNGKPYQFVYGLSDDSSTLGVVKTDIKTKKSVIWTEEGYHPSEPVFVSRPHSKDEDDGVLLSAVLHVDESRPPFLLVLDARTMTETARVEFPGIQWHNDFHGVFVPAT